MKKDIVFVLALAGFLMGVVATYVAVQARKQVAQFDQEIDGFEEVVKSDMDILEGLGSKIHEIEQRLAAGEGTSLAEDVALLRRDVQAANERANAINREEQQLRDKVRSLVGRMEEVQQSLQVLEAGLETLTEDVRRLPRSVPPQEAPVPDSIKTPRKEGE